MSKLDIDLWQNSNIKQTGFKLLVEYDYQESTSCQNTKIMQML